MLGVPGLTLKPDVPPRCSRLKCSKLAALSQTLSNLFTRCSRVMWQYLVKRRLVSSAFIEVLLLFRVGQRFECVLCAAHCDRNG